MKRMLADVEPLQHFVLVGDPEVHVRGREVGEATRVGHVHLQDLRHFIGDAVDEIGERLGRRHHAGNEVLELRGLRGRLARGLDRGDRIRGRLLDPLYSDATKPLQGDLHGVTGQIDAFVHAGRDTDTPDEFSRLPRFVVVAAGDDQRDDEPGLLVCTQQGDFHKPICTAIVKGYDRRAQGHQRKRGRQLDLRISLRCQPCDVAAGCRDV